MEYEAIVTIVERGKANDVVAKANKAGARGATIFYGRGAGEHTFSFFRSLKVDPAKEIILIISQKDHTQPIYDAIIEAAGVKEKGKGIVFKFNISDLTGISS